MALSLFQTGYRLMAGEWFSPLINAVNSLMGIQNGTGPASVTNLTQNGVETNIPQIAIAAGSNSQTNALAITKSRVVVVTVTATTRAVKLPTAATGKTVWIMNAATTGVKVYPATGDKIGAAATNAVGAAILKQKGNIYTAKDATTWQIITGA